MKLCKIQDCNKKHKAFGYCDSHYKQSKKGQVTSIVKFNTTTCSITNCTNQYRANGFCRKHDNEHKSIKCINCNNFVYLKGVCQPCYKKEINNDSKCVELGCENKILAKNVCSIHYLRKNKDKIYKKVYEFQKTEKGKCSRKLYNSLKRIRNNKVKWVNNYYKEIKLFYNNCPKGHSVDHIIPLNNKDVCGLHVPWNLQYLTISENCSKNNKFDNTYDNNSWRQFLSYETLKVA